ncbi:MAG: pyridoxal-dependent decarboxylase [Cyanobacteria bacterium P01_A01_bin.135]
MDTSFSPNPGLNRAVELLQQPSATRVALPKTCPEQGIGETQALEQLAPYVLGDAAPLDSPEAIAHMDPPTPWITWATAMWNARLNQNLLHPSTAPFATQAEERVLSWLTPFFGMGGGHFCSGSTLANLTALWAARDTVGIKQVVASKAAHISIEKAARILGLPYRQVLTNSQGQIDPNQLGDLSDAALVLIAGTTTTGAIDPLDLAQQAKWTHVDAAWGGPLRLSRTHAHLLEGIQAADSVTISAHKWLFQPKESALVMFRQPQQANEAISFGGSYLATLNIGLQGSRGAAAVPLLATLLAWGREGMAARIDRTMAIAQQLAEAIASMENLELWAQPTTGITLFRPTHRSVEAVYQHLPTGMLSTATVQGKPWLRSVTANPMADVHQIANAIHNAMTLQN